MNGLLTKILVGVSLAAIIALAVPLGLMTATIIRGESPRQLAKNAKVIYTVGTADKTEQDDAQPEPEAEPAEPVQPMTVGEQLGFKPQVQPDPQLDTVPEAEVEVTPEPAPEPEPAPSAEPEPEPEPAPAPSTTATKKTTTSQKPKTTVKKSTNPSKSVPAAQEPVQVKQELEPVPQEAATAEPVYELDPNYVPSMFEWMNDPAYLQAIQQMDASDIPYVPSIFGDSTENYDVGEGLETSNITSDSEDQDRNNTVPANGNSGNENTSGGSSSSGIYEHDFSKGLLGTRNSNKYHSHDCMAAQKIPPENEIWFKSVTEAEANGYSKCGICYR